MSAAAIRSSFRALLEKLRVLFFVRSLREKLLTFLFVAVLVLIWFFSFTDRLQASTRHAFSIKSERSDQNRWFEVGERAEREFDERMRSLDVANLPNRNAVTGQIDTLLRQGGFQFRMDPPRSDQRDPLTFNTLGIAIERATLDDLIRFTDEIRSTMPYITLEQITLAPDRRNPTQLDVRMRLVAIEFNR
ncbi:MAG: hypothetical protein EA425_08875 [Puniceicoccaceae bacterium]|nr:MAG: hypothetical protein EA425_08875 [Puniceicoccaceae bacterium]